MCDTHVFMKDVSATGSVVLCKNSDRPSFDCQPLSYHGAKEFKKGDNLKLAYLTIPQAEKRYATIGSSPYWCWGYEEGMNEFGVAIGNEAVYTKDLPENCRKEEAGEAPQKGLLGMELLRLGLERGKTAQEALKVITDLVEEYGQWGSGVPMQNTVDGSYNNSFIIADCKEAYILETAGKRWAERRLTEGFDAISNELSIRTEISGSCADLKEYALSRGWWDGKREFDFAAAYINQLVPRQVSRIRVQRARQLLRKGVEKNGKIPTDWAKKILRDHYEDTFLEGPKFNPSSPDFLTICMHESPAHFTWGITASSFIAPLFGNEGHLPMFYWAPCVPCCSVYIPVFVDAAGLPEALSNAGTYGRVYTAPSEVSAKDAYKEGSLWWEIRRLLDEINGDENGTGYEERHTLVRKEFDRLEKAWQEEVPEIEKTALELKENGCSEEAAALLRSFTEKCVEETYQAIDVARKAFQKC